MNAAETDGPANTLEMLRAYIDADEVDVPDDCEPLYAPFDHRRAPVVLEHHGTLAELEPRWDQLLAADREASEAASFKPGMIIAALVFGCGLIYGAAYVVGLACVGLAVLANYRWNTRDRRERLDSRKRELLRGALKAVEQRVGKQAQVRLRVDFRTPREAGSRVVTEHADHWTLALPPAEEATTHPWFELEFDDDEELSYGLRVRSLFGEQGQHMHLRDELELELRSPKIEAQAELELDVQPKLELIANRVRAQRALALLRTRERTTCELPSFLDLDEVPRLAALAVPCYWVWRKVMPERMQSWRFANYCGLLDADTLFEQLEACRAQLDRPADAVTAYVG